MTRGLLDEFLDCEPVLLDAFDGTKVTKKMIRDRVSQISDSLSRDNLAFLFCESSIAPISDFHALFESDIPMVLVDANVSVNLVKSLIDLYEPEALLGVVPLEVTQGYEFTDDKLWRRLSRHNHPPIHDELSVLLTTSGSTGSPKLVRLSRQNVLSNARSIAESLSIKKEDRGLTALPAFYSFGMSVLTSHAIVGSQVVVTNQSVLEKEFWNHVEHWQVTFIPGVPQTFQTLKKLRFVEKVLPRISSVRALLQAGGRLEPELIEEFGNAMSARGGSFFVMYGQTEASPRITVLPPIRLKDKIGSVGLPLNGSRIEIHGDHGPLAVGQVGNVVIYGPNVMMGYALCRADLSRGHTQGSYLPTGDLGFLDHEGFLFLTGRINRFVKIAGKRISLDDVETLTTDFTSVAAVEAPEGHISIFTTSDLHDDACRRLIAQKLGVPFKRINITRIDAFPRLASGKLDYQTLSELA